MDSITQATLGAAVGQAILGKKLGNKAIFLGAVAGTIPDLDVLSRLFLDHEIYGLIYHRGFTHSIAFTVLLAPVFGWLTQFYYQKGLHHHRTTQSLLAVFWAGLYALLLVALAAGSYFSFSPVLISLTLLATFGAYKLYRHLHKKISQPDTSKYDVSLFAFSTMYFFAFLTHWLIDACTAYGTQIFEPFSRFRVAFNNISIVDPLYTVPMIIGLMVALFAKNYATKKRANYIGIGVASLYLASTFYTKSIMNKVVAANLNEQNIQFEEYITYPSIFNTVLWQTTIKTADAYYYGYYSMLSKEKTIQFIKLPKNHDLIEKYKGEEYLNILLWFANGYYNVVEQADGSIVFNNLRFGMMGLPEDSSVPQEDQYIFRFKLTEKNGEFDVEEYRDFDQLDMGEMAETLWSRIKGQE